MARTLMPSVPPGSRRYLFAKEPEQRDPPRPTMPGEEIGHFDLAEYVRRTVLAHVEDAERKAGALHRTAILHVLGAVLVLIVAVGLWLGARALQSEPEHQETSVAVTKPLPVERDASTSSSAAPTEPDVNAALIAAANNSLSALSRLLMAVGFVFGAFLLLIAVSRHLRAKRHLSDAWAGRTQMALVPEGNAAQSPVIDAVIASMLERGEIVDATAPQRPHDLAPAR